MGAPSSGCAHGVHAANPTAGWSQATRATHSLVRLAVRTGQAARAAVAALHAGAR
jgi:hypothetical protein